MAIKLPTYKHSGVLGDLIYSLSILPKMSPGKFLVAIDNIEICVTKYGYGRVEPAHKGRFSEKDYEMLLPLLEAQPYIKKIGKWYKGDAEPTVDLDNFRNVLFRGFRGNYVEAYHKTFDVPFSSEDMLTPWLVIPEPIRVAKIVIARTPRYQSLGAVRVIKTLNEQYDFEQNAVFVGTAYEHVDYTEATGLNIKHYPIDNYLHLAQVIAGADLFMSNQTFAYSLAMGVGQNTILETIKDRTLQQNECYFPRSNCKYF